MDENRGLSGIIQVGAVLGTSLFGAAIGYWNSIGPHIASHSMSGYDGYFDGMLITFGALLGLAVGSFAAKLHRAWLAWVVAPLLTAVTAGVIPFVFASSTINHSRETIGWLCPIVFCGVHGIWTLPRWWGNYH